MRQRLSRTTPYSTLADVYDYFNSYNKIKPWLDRVWMMLKGLGVTSGCLLDIGSGTSSSAKFWTNKGFDLYCLDVSLPMLTYAKAKNQNVDCQYICGSYESLKTIPSFTLVTAINDVANYIAYRDGTLIPFFERAYSILKGGGILVFDALTPSVRHWLEADRSIKIDRWRCIRIKHTVRHLRKSNILISVITMRSKSKTSLEEHILTLLEPEKVRLMLDYVGFHNILIGDLMLSGLTISELPSIDIIAIKG